MVDYFLVECFDDDWCDVVLLNVISNGVYNLYLILCEYLLLLWCEIVWWWWMLVGMCVYFGFVYVLLLLFGVWCECVFVYWCVVCCGVCDVCCMNFVFYCVVMLLVMF